MKLSVNNLPSKMTEALREIQQPRSTFELEHFVVGQHDTEPRRYAQCVLELQIKFQALKRAQIQRRQIDRRITRLKARCTDSAKDKAELLRIDLEDLDLAILGATREVEALYAIFQRFKHHFTRAELNAAEEEYWQRRLTRQALQDVIAHGRIAVGNQDALRQIGMPVAPQPDYLQSVEKRFLIAGNVRIVVVVPTLISREELQKVGLRCLDGWTIPGSFQWQIHVVDGRPVADAYTEGVLFALGENADFVLCVEDDHVIPPGAFERLWHLWKERGPRAIVGAWYPQKKQPRTGAAIVLRDGRREYLADDGSVQEVYAITQGFTLIPAATFHEIPQPWFATTGVLTQDAFFSQLVREAGYQLLVDTSLRIAHVDRTTGERYE